MRERVYNHYLDLRALLYLIDNNNLEMTAETCDLIKLCQSDDVKIRGPAMIKLRAIPTNNMEEKTLRELRDHAQQLGVMGYSRLSKLELLSILKERTYEKEETKTGT